MSTSVAVPRTASDRRHEHEPFWLIGPTVGLCFTIACAVLFNISPHKVGYYRTIVDAESFVPLLGPGFAAFLPILNVWWALSFCLEVAHLTLGRRTILTRFARLVVDIFGATVLFSMAAGEPFLRLPGGSFAPRSLLVLAGLGLLLGALTRFITLVKRWLAVV